MILGIIKKIIADAIGRCKKYNKKKQIDISYQVISKLNIGLLEYWENPISIHH